jgi:hypothetical protein
MKAACHALIAASILGLSAGEVVSAQDSAAAAVERIAALAALARLPEYVVASPTMALNPSFVQANAAPGFTVVGLRPESRNLALAAVLGANSLSREQVIRCDGPGKCTMATDVFVSMSDVEFTAGNVACVTVTVQARSYRPGLIYYETLRLTLENAEQTWRVPNLEQLGIS